MYVCVIGTGYVGLVTGAVFADLGNDVICVDSNERKIADLKNNILPIYEPGLEEMVRRNQEDGRLTFTTDTTDGVRRSDVVFIAVGTPPADDGSTDLQYVEAVAKAIAASIDRYKIIVNKSTVPPGTGDFVRQTIEANKRRAVDFDVVSNPEFLKEGTAIQDSLLPDRIVIGAPSQHVAMSLLELYAPLEAPMLITDVASAEMIKYASNAFLATKISFINSVANICEKVGADVGLVAKGMGSDKRIGKEFLHAGLGYGGSCFPKDTLSLIHTAKKFGETFDILESVVKTNSERTPRFIDRIKEHMSGDVKGKTFGVLGLAFKPDTDDMRDAKSVEVINALAADGAKFVAYDPISTENAKSLLPPDVKYVDGAYEVAKGVDALIIMTEWKEFKGLKLEQIRDSMKRPLVFDGRNIYPVDRMERLGFEYVSIGRKPVQP
ncbi:MAG: UDP-glucose/GDP-mannose dehydrogenase family protein [Candidatus Sumerlaeia bacterium]|nr:UDP-glucose/GDP-mannose dehydrogenase family protein [Candidatus Sumerlaeia bacterium]